MGELLREELWREVPELDVLQRDALPPDMQLTLHELMVQLCLICCCIYA